MRTFTARSAAPPAVVWPLYARPDRWSEWSPHLRGAWGLGTPEVEPGRAGAVRLLGALPVPARIVAKLPGRSWTWQVGPVTMVHRVEPRGDGSEIALDLEAPGPLEAVVVVAYGPVVAVLLRNLARVAARQVPP